MFASQQGLWSRKFVKMFLDDVQTIKYWCNETFKWKNWHDQQYQAVWLIAGKWSLTQWCSVHTGTPDNINKVEDLAVS